MSFSTENLQDFVMNLINDEAAKAAYAADPLAALKDAGLADLTPADVQEVLPLVADSLPAGLPTDLSALPVDLPAGVPSLDALPTLDALPMDSLPTGVPSLSDLPLDLPTGIPSLSDLPLDLPTGVPSLSDLPLDLPAGVPSLSDLPLDLPAGVPSLSDLPLDLPTGVPSLSDLPSLPGVPTLATPLGDVTAVVDGAATSVDLDGDVLTSATSAFAANPADADAPTVSTYLGSDFGDLAAGGKVDADEFGGSVAGSTDLADAGLGLVGHSNGNVGAWGGLDTVAGDLAGGVQAGPDGVAIATESPLGSFSVDSTGAYTFEPADPSDLLDVDHLGDTGDAVAGTVAHYAGTGGDTLSGGVASGADTLAGFLTGPFAPAAGVVEIGADTVTDGIDQGGDTLSEHLTSLPTVNDLPLHQLPELPQLPDAAQLPDLGALPVDLPTLPVDLPDTGAVTDLVSNNPVTDAVHASPVGGLVDGVTSHLPSVGDLPADLDLGL